MLTDIRHSLRRSYPSLNPCYLSKLWTPISGRMRHLKRSLAITPNSCDGLLIRMLSSLIGRPPKLYWFIRNGHHSLTTSSLNFRKPPTSICLIAIPFSPGSDKSLIKTSHFYWSCSILVFPEFA
ncbi:unnamed protein product [Protopolystoma xenopodis]|uniref:Uncharacterized protein n=1 Tax=Protopolystoma xenopodis TaxID=117903 RepID=A0A3S5AGY5_9PLAT|nr:unnamed protein product [Protopolystoma xenopodis]